jgi:hypothetical protein
MSGTPSNTIRIGRLLKLAKHLETTRKLIHKNFSFSIFNSADSAPALTGMFDATKARRSKKYGCGTSGCAIGECPAVFPEWSFQEFGTYILPVLDGMTPSDITEPFKVCSASAVRFFGLTKKESNHLFYPYRQDIVRYSGRSLEGDATAKDVASNIRAFVREWKKNPWNRSANA